MTVLRLPDWAGEEIDKMVERKGLPFATIVKSMVVEHLRENMPDGAKKRQAGTRIER